MVPPANGQVRPGWLGSQLYHMYIIVSTVRWTQEVHSFDLITGRNFSTGPELSSGRRPR